MEAARVICILVDRLGAAALSAYGGAWSETPALDRLASQSLVCDQALSESPDLAAVARILWQGLHPLALQEGERPGLIGALTAGGRTATLVTDDRSLAELPEAAPFSERFVWPGESPGGPAAQPEATQLARFVAAAISWLESHDGPPDQPDLLWIQTQGLSGVWDAPPEYRREVADPDDPTPPDFVEPPDCTLPADYDPDELLGIVQAHAGQVVLLDECLAALLAWLDDSDWAGRSLLVLTSPRGYPLGEHHRVGPCDGALYAESVHVPLLLRLPDGRGQLERYGDPVGLLDLEATLAEWLGLDGPRSGRSLLAEIDGRDEDAGRNGAVRDRVCLCSPGGERALRTPAWHLRVPVQGPPELYVKPDDRFEANELVGRCGEIVRGLEAALAEYEQALRAGSVAQLGPLDEVLVTAPT